MRTLQSIYMAAKREFEKTEPHTAAFEKAAEKVRSISFEFDRRTDEIMDRYHEGLISRIELLYQLPEGLN